VSSLHYVPNIIRIIQVSQKMW